MRHTKAVLAVAKTPVLQLALRKGLNNQCAKIDQSLDKDDEDMYKEWQTNAMRIYFLAKHNLPYKLHSDLSFLIRDTVNQASGSLVFAFPAHTYGSYDSRGAAVEMVSSCAESIMGATTASIINAHFYSLMIDESSDISVSKNLVIMARYQEAGNVITRMLGLVSLTDGCATTVDDAVMEVVARRGLSDVHIVGFATDGASVMRGRINGVVTRFKARNPLLVSVHCPGHVLELAVEDAVESFEQERIVHVRATYTYFNKSQARRKMLANAAKLFGIGFVRPLQQSFTRWLFLGDALRNIDILFVAIQHVLAHDSSTAAAHKLYNDFYGDGKNQIWVACMQDIVAVVNELSRALQSESMNIVSVLPIVASTKS